MSTHTHEIEVQVSRERLVQLLSDPFLLSGVFGHVSILEGFDKNRQAFVPPDSLSSPTTRFKVIYIFGTPEQKIYTNLGEMTGPEFTVNGISYHWFTYDGKIKGTIDFEIKTVKPTTTQVRIIVSFNYEQSFLDRIAGRQHFDLAEHVVKAHIVPYLRLYLKGVEGNSLNITPILKFSEEGAVGVVISKAMMAVRDVQYGVVVVDGENVQGEMYVKNGKVTDAEVFVGGQRVSGSDAVIQLLQVQDVVRVLVYTVDVESAIMSVLSSIPLKVLAEKARQERK